MNKNISNKTLDPTDRRFRWRSRRREKERERERENLLPPMTNPIDLSKKNLYRVIVQLKAQRVFRSEDPRKAKVTRARFLFQFGLRVKLYALQRNIRVTWIGY